MAIFHFDSDIAKELDINAAVIYQNIKYWCEKNRANDKHFHDGLYWTYNSTKAFKELFPFLTIRQTRSALKRLETAGYVKTGNFNNAAYDRTLWYADTAGKAICQNRTMDLSEKANGFVTDGKPIPDSKPDINTDKRVIDHFEDWWKEYPRKIGKGKAEENYLEVVKSGRVTESVLLRSIRQTDFGDDVQFIPHPATWLTQERWLDEPAKKQKPDWMM